MKTTVWFGVYDPKGQLVDCTPGQYHAQEIVKAMPQGAGKHTVNSVTIAPVTAPAEPASVGSSATPEV